MICLFSATSVSLHLWLSLVMLQNLSDCTLNPLTRNHLASSLPQTALKAILSRIAMVLIATYMSELGHVQPSLLIISAVYITYNLLVTVRSRADSGIHA
jgi:hypothetical protein